MTFCLMLGFMAFSEDTLSFFWKVIGIKSYESEKDPFPPEKLLECKIFFSLSYNIEKHEIILNHESL